MTLHPVKALLAMAAGSLSAALVVNFAVGPGTRGMLASRMAGLSEVPRLAWQSWRLERIRGRAGERLEEVQAGIHSEAAPAWAGDYRWSNMHESTSFTLSENGFVFHRQGCPGTCELAHGEVVEAHGDLVRLDIHERLVLEPPYHHGGRRPFELAEVLHSVPWGSERFLVPDELMIEFCELVHADRFDAMKYADYPRLDRSGEWQLPTLELEGLPDAPEEFRRYLPE